MWGRGPNSFFCIRYEVVSALFFFKYIFLPLNSFQQSINHKCMGLFLYSQFYSIDLYIYLYGNTTQSLFLIIFKKKFCLFIYLFYFWLCWVFISVWGLSLVAASGGHSSSRCAGLSLPRLLLLRSTGSRRAGSVVVAHRPSCSTACGVFPDQGSNPCPPHWQADSQPLRHQGSPRTVLITVDF